MAVYGCDEEFGATGPGQDLDSLFYAKNVGMTWVRIFVKWDLNEQIRGQPIFNVGGPWCPPGQPQNCGWYAHSLEEDVAYAKGRGFKVLVVVHRTLAGPRAARRPKLTSIAEAFRRRVTSLTIPRPTTPLSSERC
jgi:hypothetical protein